MTALVALLPPVRNSGAAAHARAIDWLMGTTGEESTAMYRVRQWLLGMAPMPEHEFPGWPWIPGAAAWVGPTSLAILALEKEMARRPSTAAQRRIEEGRAFCCGACARAAAGITVRCARSAMSARRIRKPPEWRWRRCAACARRRLEPALDVAQRFLSEVPLGRRAELAAHRTAGPRPLPEGYCPPAPVACRTLPGDFPGHAGGGHAERREFLLGLSMAATDSPDANS